MRRLVAVSLVGVVMTLAALPAFAECVRPCALHPGQDPDQPTNPQNVDASGLGTLGQVPNNDNNTNNLLIGGLALGAAGGIIGLIASHHNDEQPVSP